MSKETDKTQLALETLMADFLERYSPAQFWDEATEHFTSTEITEMFTSVYPIPLEDIFEALKGNGFKCVPQGNQASFVWLLKQT